jgi:hypothetical protein
MNKRPQKLLFATGRLCKQHHREQSPSNGKVTRGDGACVRGKGSVYLMPLTSKGKKIKASMEKQYGKEQGERVFYASEKKGNIKGVAKKPAKKGKK